MSLMHLSRTLALVLVFRFISGHNRAGIVGRVFTVIFVCSFVRPLDAFSLSSDSLPRTLAKRHTLSAFVFDVMELVLSCGRMFALRRSFILLVLCYCAPVRSASSPIYF